MRNKTREDAIATLIGEGVPRPVALLVLRDAATIARLSEADCNGDWPCDNGERKVRKCEVCEGLYAPSTLTPVAYMTEGKGGRKYYRQTCQSCRAEARITARLAPYGIVPKFDGDPRGYTVKAILPSGKYNTWGGREEGFGLA